MESEKVTEVEMEDITPAEKIEEEDAAKHSLLQTTDVYQKLDDLKEDVYSKIATSASTTKETKRSNTLPEGLSRNKHVLVASMTKPFGMNIKVRKLENYVEVEKAWRTQQEADIKKKARLYWRTSIFLLVLCLLLLAVIFALALKLLEARSVQSCPERVVEKEDKSDKRQVCSPQLCQDMHPTLVVQNEGHQCTECGKNWLKFENSCYLMSTQRLTWQKSREECQKWGGDLAVINNDLLQKFLTSGGYMLYWIGLSYSETQKWMWIDNTTLTQSYWASDDQSNNPAKCALLKGKTTPKKNWILNPCLVSSHYICQRHLK